MPINSESVGRRAKRPAILDSGILVTHICYAFDLVVFMHFRLIWCFGLKNDL